MFGLRIGVLVLLALLLDLLAAIGIGKFLKRSRERLEEYDRRCRREAKEHNALCEVAFALHEMVEFAFEIPMDRCAALNCEGAGVTDGDLVCLRGHTVPFCKRHNKIAIHWSRKNLGRIPELDIVSASPSLI